MMTASNDIIEKLVICTNDPGLLYVFGTADIRDARVVSIKGSTNAENNITSVRIICYYFSEKKCKKDILIDYHCFHSLEMDRMLNQRIKATISGEFTVANKRLIDYPSRKRSICIGVRKEMLLDTDGQMKMDAALKMRNMAECLYKELLDGETNLHNIFMQNFPLLFRNRELIYKTPQYYCSIIGTSFCRSSGTYNIGNRKVMLGSMLRAYEMIPEWLTIPNIKEEKLLKLKGEKDQEACNCEESYLITGSGGSPLSGVGSGECICPKCGSILYVRTGHNPTRIRELNVWLDKENAENPDGGTSLYAVVQEIVTQTQNMKKCL